MAPLSQNMPVHVMQLFLRHVQVKLRGRPRVFLSAFDCLYPCLRHVRKVPQQFFFFFPFCSMRWRGAGMEIYLLISSLSSHRVVAKIHRSLHIKFLELTWHTAVNQSMKGKLICCSPSLALSFLLLLSIILMSFYLISQKTPGLLYISKHTESLKVKPLNSLHYGFLLVLFWLDYGWIPSLTDAFILSLCIIMYKWFRLKCALLISQHSLRCYLPMCLRSNQQRLLASLTRRLNGLRPDEHFQGGESVFPPSRICTLQFFLGRHFLSRRGNSEKTYVTFCSQKHFDIYFSSRSGPRPLIRMARLLWRLNVIFCVRGLFIT